MTTEAGLSYLIVRQPSAVVATMQINDAVLVDFDADGHILGIESLAGPVDFGVVLAVLGDDRVGMRMKREV